MVFNENRVRSFIKDLKQNLSARAQQGARAFGFQRRRIASLATHHSDRIGHRPLRPADLRLRRASFFFRGSSKYGGSAAAEPSRLCPLSDTHFSFSVSHRAIPLVAT